MQGFQYIIFKKYLFSPIYKGDYLATFDFKVCFFSLLQIWYLGQNAFLEKFFSPPPSRENECHKRKNKCHKIRF